MSFLSFWFWPNPGGWHYSDTRVVAVLIACSLLILTSFALRFWRRSLQNSVTRSLTRSWPLGAFWFGFIGLVFAFSRVEMIQFLAMRAAWALWLALLVLFASFQFVQFRRRHYTVLQRTTVVDEREKYLPKAR